MRPPLPNSLSQTTNHTWELIKYITNHTWEFRVLTLFTRDFMLPWFTWRSGNDNLLSLEELCFILIISSWSVMLAPRCRGACCWQQCRKFPGQRSTPSKPSKNSMSRHQEGLKTWVRKENIKIFVRSSLENSCASCVTRADIQKDCRQACSSLHQIVIWICFST